MAHLKGVGRYANDAWRIFCKDRMYEQAGNKPAAPEWKRVVPKDKELIAYLVWRWKREGYDWNPEGGALPRQGCTDIEDLVLEMDRLSLDNLKRHVKMDDKRSFSSSVRKRKREEGPDDGSGVAKRFKLDVTEREQDIGDIVLRKPRPTVWWAVTVRYTATEYTAAW